MRSMLAAEAKGEPGSPTLNETFTGLAGGDFSGGGQGLGHQRHEHRAHHAAGQRRQGDPRPAAGRPEQGASYTYGVLDGNGNFVPQAGGPWSAPPVLEVPSGAAGQNAQTTVVDDPAMRGRRPAHHAGHGRAGSRRRHDPRTGEPIDSTGDMPIAWAYNVPKGGTTVTTYGFQTKDSGFVFSSNPPGRRGSPRRVLKDGQSRP